MSQVEKVMMFIDASNIWRALEVYNKDHGTNHRISYAKLRDKLVSGRRLIRPYYFCSRPSTTPPPQMALLEGLRSQGFTVVDKILKEVFDSNSGRTRRREKGVDVALVTYLISLAWEGAYETVIVVSGDSDLVEAIQCVKNKGKRVELASFRGALGREIRQVADNPVTVIDDIIGEITLP